MISTSSSQTFHTSPTGLMIQAAQQSDATSVRAVEPGERHFDSGNLSSIPVTGTSSQARIIQRRDTVIVSPRSACEEQKHEEPSSSRPSTIDQTKKEKQAIRKQKNNEASKLCRENRKRKHREMEEQVKTLEEENQSLQQQIALLTQERDLLKSYLSEHLKQVTSFRKQ